MIFLWNNRTVFLTENVSLDSTITINQLVSRHNWQYGSLNGICVVQALQARRGGKGKSGGSASVVEASEAGDASRTPEDSVCSNEGPSHYNDTDTQAWSTTRSTQWTRSSYACYQDVYLWRGWFVDKLTILTRVGTPCDGNSFRMSLVRKLLLIIVHILVRESPPDIPRGKTCLYPILNGA